LARARLSQSNAVSGPLHYFSPTLLIPPKVNADSTAS
jgi:hypothetical protein